MSYSISTLLIRNLHDVFGENDSARMGVHFPVLARRIVEEHRRHVSAETANRRALLLRRIPNIAAELHSRGLYPSVERILEHLPERSRRDRKTISFAVREAHKALGITR